MRRRAAAVVILLSLGTWVLGSNAPKPNKVPVKIIGSGSDFPGQVWGQVYFPPLLSFRVTKGKVPTGTTLCDVVTEHKETGERTYSTIVLHCEEGLVMELEGIDLKGGSQ